MTTPPIPQPFVETLTWFADLIGQSVANHMKQDAQIVADNETYSREEYAQLRGVHPNTVSQWYKAGDIQGYKEGRRLRIYKNQMRKAI